MRDSTEYCLLRVAGQLALVAVLAGTAGAQTGKVGHGKMMKADALAMAQMSHEAAKIFSDTDSAVSALSNGNKTAAMNDINMAISTRDQLATTARSHDLPKVVPVYSEMEQDSSIGPMVAKRNNGTPLPRSKEPVTVDAASAQFTFVGIDLEKTKGRLQGAKDAISKNNLQSARDTLNAIGDDLVVEKISADTPLLAIRENLGIAQTAVMSHQDTEATAALRQAALELAAYAKSGPGPHTATAREMGYSVSRMLGASAQRDPSSSATIADWWAQVNHWMKSPVA